jgi:CxxC motif-containing protein
MIKTLTCIACPIGCHLEIDIDNNYKVTGNQCKKGEQFGKKELQNPTRTVTSTVRIVGAIYPRIPVKTSEEIPKEKIFEVMNCLNEVCLKSPVKINQVVIKNVADTGTDIITTRSL